MANEGERREAPVTSGSFGHGPERRIRKRAEFVRIQTIGERATTRHFVLLVAAREEATLPSRLGVVVTKKVGNAVQRSRVKRLCRECFRLWPDLLPSGIDLVVIARSGAHELDLAQVRGQWSGAHRALLERCRAALRKPSATKESAGTAPPAASSSARPQGLPRPRSPRKP